MGLDFSLLESFGQSLWPYAHIILALSLVAVSVLLWKLESDIDQADLRQGFSLTVKLLEKHKGAGSWDDVRTLDDLVVLNPKASIFWQRPFYFRRAGLKIRYLSLMVDDALAACKKSGPSSVFLFKSLVLMKSKNLIDPKMMDNYLNQTQLRLTQEIDKAWDSVFEAVHNWTNLLPLIVQSANFKLTLNTAEETCVPPISNLTDYTDERQFLLTSKFLYAFKYQMETNLKRLELMDPVSRSQAALHLLVLVFSDPIVEKSLKLDGKKTLFHLELIDLQVSDLLELLQSHIMFCNGAFPDIQLDFFRNSKVNPYFIENGETLHNFFSQPIDAVQFPTSTLNITQFQRSTVQIRNEHDFKRLRGQYEQLLLMNEKITKMAPTSWPTYLPNLSTHNGLPMLCVGGVEDFYLILAAYAEYTKRLEILKKAWSISLRVLYSTLEDTGHE